MLHRATARFDLFRPLVRSTGLLPVPVLFRPPELSLPVDIQPLGSQTPQFPFQESPEVQFHLNRRFPGQEDVVRSDRVKDRSRFEI